jgi:hypothetical protein
VFKGDPIAYRPFIQEFEENVERLIHDDAGRLARLVQLCEGEVATLLKGCRYISPASKAYRQARKILDDRYGGRTLLVEAWTSHLTKRFGTMRELAVELQSGVDALTGIGAIKEASHHSYLDAVAARFPERLHREWRRAVREARTRESYPTLVRMTALVRAYVEEEEDEERYDRDRPSRRDDRRGEARRSPRRSPTKTKRRRSRSPLKQPPASTYRRNQGPQRQQPTTVLAIASGIERCPHCQAAHHLKDCREFQLMDVSHRRRAVMDARLCFLCLGSGHRADSCTGRTCESCRGRHHSLLHGGYKRDRGQRDPARNPRDAPATKRPRTTTAPPDQHE